MKKYHPTWNRLSYIYIYISISVFEKRKQKKHVCHAGCMTSPCHLEWKKSLKRRGNFGKFTDDTNNLIRKFKNEMKNNL